MSNPNLISLYVGVFSGFIFFLYGLFFLKRIPTLNQVAVVILSWTGAIVGVKLGYLALTAEDLQLGLLKDERIAIVLGALAVVWTAAESFFGSVNELRLTSRSSTAPSALDGL